jgi:hypothetical protein
MPIYSFLFLDNDNLLRTERFQPAMRFKVEEETIVVEEEDARSFDQLKLESEITGLWLQDGGSSVCMLPGKFLQASDTAAERARLAITWSEFQKLSLFLTKKNKNDALKIKI